MKQPIPSPLIPFRKSSIADAVGGSLRNCKIIGVLPLCFAASALAADETPPKKDDQPLSLEKIVVTGERPALRSLNTSEVEGTEIIRKRAEISDTAKLLEDIPGFSLYGGGGVSSLPVIHGLNDDRVKVLVNGMSITSGYHRLWAHRTYKAH